MQLSVSSSLGSDGAKKSKMQEEILLNGPKAMKPSLIGMRGVEGSNKVSKERTKGWHDKRMRKKECDIRDKMLMNNSSKETFK